MRKNEGFISIFVLFILISLVTFALFVIDYSKVVLAKQTMATVNDVTISNVLAHYDKQLQQIYGLFGTGDINTNDTVKKDIIKLMVQATRGSLTEQKAENIVHALLKGQMDSNVWQEQIIRDSSKKLTNINAIFINEVPTITPIDNTSLNHTPIMKSQIVEFMKIRGLLSLGYGFYNKLNGLKGKDKALESEKYRMKYEEANHKYVKKLYELGQLYKELDNLVPKDKHLFMATNEELKEKLLSCLREKCVGESYKNSSQQLSKIVAKLDAIIDKWKGIEHLYIKTKEKFSQWESYVSSHQMNEEDKKRYQSELSILSKQLEQLNSQNEMIQLLTIKSDIAAFSKILKSIKINQTLLADYDDNNMFSQDASIDIPEFSNFNITKWQTLDGYSVIMSKYYQLGSQTIDKQQKQVIENIKRSVKQKDVALPNISFPNSKQTVLAKSVDAIDEKNVISKGIQGFNNSIQFLSQLSQLDNNFSTIMNELLVMEYATEMFSNYLDRETAVAIPLAKTELLNGISLNVLQSKFRGAEVEYILYGKNTPKENVEASINTIRLFRFGLNLMYTFMDSEIKSMIAASSAVAGPLSPIMSVFLHVLIAYCETEIDVHLLLSGKNVPIFKSTQTWIVKPSKAANGLLSLSKDYILNKINQGIDAVQSQIFQWFEHIGNNAEEKLNNMASIVIDTQVNTILDTIYNIVQKPITDIIMSLSNGASEQFESKITYYTQFIDTQWQNIMSAIDKFPIDTLRTPLKQMLEQKKEEIVTYILNSVKQLQKVDVASRTTQQFEEINRYIRELIHPITDQIKNSIQEGVAHYKKEAMTIIGNNVTRLSEQAKSKLYDLSQQYFSSSSNQTFKLGKQTASLSTLSYPEYLKLFMLLSLIADGNQSPKYERMANLIGENLSLDLSKLYTGYEVSTSYTVEQLFFKEWFKTQQQQTTVWGY